MNSGKKIFYISLGFLSVAAIALPLYAANLSPAEYRQQLRDWTTRVEQLKEHPEQAKQFESDLPEHITINDNSREYTVNYDWMKTQLKQYQQADPKTRNAFLQAIQDRLADLDKQTRAYEQSQEASSADHVQLEKILSRREFHKAHGPSWWDIMWQKVQRWLARFFGRHPISGRAGTDILHVVVYTAVGVAFIMFAIWLKQRFDRPPVDFTREIIPFAPSAKGWNSWLADARAAAQQGDWRNAVHLAYWAGISFLEEHGAWKPDRARTPREYLRILGTRKPQYPTLSALTRKFEVTWYGRHEAQAADFNEALQQLEKLGCK